jgi:methionyl-tRNA formyltransferase
LPAPETIVLLGHVPEFVSFAQNALRAHNPGLRFAHAATRAALIDLPPDLLAGARLVGLTTGVVVPAGLLTRLGFGAYNFHPGPPEFPGWDSIRFALYEGSRDFGVTAHVMTERIDEGAIVGVRRRRVRENPAYADYQSEMVKALLELIAELAPALGSPQGPPPTGVPWGRVRRRADAAALCAIPPDIDAAELERRISAFGSGEIGLRPTVTLHGARFVYAQDELFERR